MRGERNLSDFWRYDGSADRVSELASVLEGADILIGNMGSAIRVTWSGDGNSYTDFRQRIVALDYGPLSSQECPFPGSAVDEVIGYAAHEGGHCLWTLAGKEEAIRQEVILRWDSLPTALHQEWQADEEATLAGLCRIQNVMEDAYTDHQVAGRWPVLGEYIRVARSKLSQRLPIDLEAIAASPCPDRNAIINLWVGVALYGNPLPPVTSAPVKRAMDVLQSLTQWVLSEDSASLRHRMAVAAAIVLWPEFPPGQVPLPLLRRCGGAGEAQQEGEAAGDQGQAEAKPGGGAPDEGGLVAGEVRNPSGLSTQGRSLDDFDPCPGPGQRGRGVVAVPRELLDKVARAAGREIEDLSRSVAQALAEEPRRVVARAKKADYDAELAGRVTAQVQREIRDIQKAVRHRHDLKSCWLPGLSRGRLDERRLWKPFVGDPGYFKRKDPVRGLSFAVGILLDVSGSMSGYMSTVQQTAAVFSQGLLHMPGINFAAWCYTGTLAKVVLTRICDRHLPRLCLANVEQGGQTPSGAALAAAKLLMERMAEKRKLLIHFTDGQPDSAAHVATAVRACREVGIQVYAIGLPWHADMLASQYGEGSYETIRAVPELPQAVASIVKRLGAPRQ